MYSIPVCFKVNPEAVRGVGWGEPLKAGRAPGWDSLYKDMANPCLPKNQMGKDKLEFTFLTSYPITPT